MRGRRLDRIPSISVIRSLLKISSRQHRRFHRARDLKATIKYVRELDSNRALYLKTMAYVVNPASDKLRTLGERRALTPRCFFRFHHDNRVRDVR